MPAPTKFLYGFGLLAKQEGSYNSGASLSTSADGLLMEELATIKPKYANDGARPAPPNSPNRYQKRVAPSGRAVDVSVKIAPRGYGSVYSVSNVPAGHALLRACGLSAAFDGTVGAEKYTYTGDAIGTAAASAAASAYGRAQLYPLTGLLGDFTFSFKAGEVPMLAFAMQGLMASAITDVALPAITYFPPTSVLPPKAVNVGLAINGFTVSLRSLELKWGRATDPRLDANVGGHAGFAPAGRTPQLTVEFETPPIASLDPFNLFDAGTALSSWGFTIGTVQYNKYTIGGQQLQFLQPPEEGADGQTSTTKCVFQCNPSSLGNNDELSWVFN